jgi:two-component system CheB/CheR fusion protein
LDLLRPDKIQDFPGALKGEQNGLGKTVRSGWTGSGTGTFPIVGIGASAGGLEALTSLLQALPIDTGLAFVVIQYLDPKHESMLPDILARIRVRQVSDGMLVEPNYVYVIPANTGLALSQQANRWFLALAGSEL